MSDEIASSVEALITEAGLYLKARSELLDHDDPYIRFCLMTVPNIDHIDPNVSGYHRYILYASSHGYLSCSKEEAEEAVETVNLSPGDTTISAYRINGPDRPTCESLSKVLAVKKDGVTPTKLLHIWPLEYPNKAIDLVMIWGKEIEDMRV